ncbi:MAG: NAD(P)-binding domain-containing protein [Gemmatimonadales bacterium]|nr:NAD(P)-binding domain-containing protein [Gemmatimonadales bacterium]
MLPLAVGQRSIEVEKNELPIAVIGAGPVGLAAAAHLVQRGATPLVLEAGTAVGASVLGWGHVRIFSPWKYNVDTAARDLLDRRGWTAPDGEDYPTGRELVESYLRPLAATPEIAPHLRLSHRVTAVTRLGFDKMKTGGREEAPFAITVATPSGEQQLLARAVIDASGTYTLPNPLGASGTPARGEAQAADRIFYGIADVLGGERARYAGRRVLVIGSGHSAFDVLIDLAELAETEPRTTITWLVRRPFADSKYGGATNDALPARGALGTRMRELVERGAVRQEVLRISELRRTSDGVHVSDGDRELGPFDEIIATTGFRPDLAPLRELRVRLDDILEAPPALAPLIDPNVHSCGTVPPHGARELEHPEKDFYIVGMKSYGRAPTFLMLTGYEQVRSIVSALVGDAAGAARVELALPQTGVCSGRPGSDCCDDAATDCGSPTSTCCGTTDAVIPLTALTAAPSR